MSIEAMKQALEALRNAEVVYMEQLNAMYALQQAIEQADQQEPVAWMSVDCVGERYLHFSKPLDNDPVHPLYTAPVHASDIPKKYVHESDKDRHDCNTCENRGVLIPLAQETYCENCIYGSSWKKNYYKEKNHEH
jgi:hypothetical protein